MMWNLIEGWIIFSGQYMATPYRSYLVNHWMVSLWEEYCAKFLIRDAQAESPSEIDDQANALMEIWQAYASRFLIALPEDQLPPDYWDGKIPALDETGRLKPEGMTNWRFWADTRSFLRDRYGVLESPSLSFDCQVYAIQRQPVPISPEDREFYGYPRQGDPPEWYAGAIQMTIFRSQIRFRCRSMNCGRGGWCDLKKRKSVDLFGLIKASHGFNKMAPAVRLIEDWFGLRFAPFASSANKPSSTKRFKVSCKDIEDLIARHVDLRDDVVGRGQKLKGFLVAATRLISESELVDYSGRPAPEGFVYMPQSVVHQGTLWQMGKAARLWLWLWCYQSEQARRRKQRKGEFKPSDAKVADLWGVHKDTIKEQRKRLEGLGYFKIVGGEWRVFSNPQK
jgi:hypothetical protein